MGRSKRSRLEPAAAGFTFLAAISSFLSIFVSHTAHAIALALLVARGTKLRWPPIAGPVCAFFGWSVISALFSGDPLAAWPQLRKVFVYSLLITVYTVCATRQDARRVVHGWAAAAFASVLVSFWQFAYKWELAKEAGSDFLAYYEGARITGFLSHWQTFSQAVLLALVALTSYVLFARAARAQRTIWLVISLTIGLGLYLSFTRSVWLAIGIVGLYFAWMINRRLLWLAPITLAIVAIAAPVSVQQRALSAVSLGENSNRIIMWRAGWTMIKERTWFGIGTGRMAEAFPYYIPEDVNELPLGYYGHLHSIYVHYAAERGVPALLALLWLLGKVVWDHGRALRRAPPGGDDRYLLHAGVAGTIAVLTVGLTDLTLGDSEVLGTYLILIAVTYRAVERTLSPSPPAAG